MITYWPLDDALVQTYTLPYLRIIQKNLAKDSKIILVTLDKNAPSRQAKEGLQKENIQHISLPYKPFGIAALFEWIGHLRKLLSVIKKQKVDVLHCFCTPAGAAGYILSKVSGKPLVVDSFEPHAEPMVESGTWKRNSLAFKLLFWLEKKQAKHAANLVGTTQAMAEYAKQKYGVQIPNMLVKPACIDLNQFSFSNKKKQELLLKLGLENKIVAVYAGKFGGSYLEGEFFKLLKTAREYWENQFKALLLTSHSDEYLEEQCKKVNLLNEVIIKEFVPHSQVADYIGLGDFGITPFKPVPSKRYGTPIKTGEYWALGLPVIITPNISDDSQIIEENSRGAIWDSNNDNSYLESIKKIDQLLQQHTTDELYHKIRPLAEKYRNFKIAEKVYHQLYGI